MVGGSRILRRVIFMKDGKSVGQVEQKSVLDLIPLFPQ